MEKKKERPPDKPAIKDFDKEIGLLRQEEAELDENIRLLKQDKGKKPKS